MCRQFIIIISYNLLQTNHWDNCYWSVIGSIICRPTLMYRSGMRLLPFQRNDTSPKWFNQTSSIPSNMFVNQPVLWRALLLWLITLLLARISQYLTYNNHVDLVIIRYKLLALNLEPWYLYIPSICYIRSFRTCGWERLHDALHSAPWHIMDIFDDINDKWVFFLHAAAGLFGQVLPLKKVTVCKARRPTPWFNDNISTSIRAKNNAKQTLERSGPDSDRNIYHKLKHKLKASINLIYCNNLITNLLNLLCFITYKVILLASISSVVSYTLRFWLVTMQYYN